MTNGHAIAHPPEPGIAELLIGDFGFWSWRRFNPAEGRLEVSRESYSSMELCRKEERRARRPVTREGDCLRLAD